MLLTLVRHGQTTSNAAGIWQGQGDSHLDDLGRQQAQKLAERLADERFDRVVTSDLSRAVETAEYFGRPYEPDAAFREIGLGSWEGLTREQVGARWPDEVAALRAGEDIKVGGGESWSEVERRVTEGLVSLRRRYRDDRHVLLVAHGGVVVTLVSVLLGAAGQRPRPVGRLLNASICRLDLTPGGVRLLVYNDAVHADPGGIAREADKRGHRLQDVREPPTDTRVGPDQLGPLAEGLRGLVEHSADGAVLAAWNVQ